MEEEGEGRGEGEGVERRGVVVISIGRRGGEKRREKERRGDRLTMRRRDKRYQGQIVLSH